MRRELVDECVEVLNGEPIAGEIVADEIISVACVRSVTRFMELDGRCRGETKFLVDFLTVWKIKRGEEVVFSF